MKYLHLICSEKADSGDLPERPKEGHWEAWGETLRERGHPVLGQQSPRGGVSFRALAGKTFVTDGPFAETKENLAGFCRGDAVPVTSKARAGSVDVRRVGPSSRSS